MSPTILSTSLIAEFNFFVGRRRNTRITLATIFLNRSHVPNLSPLVSIEASLAWNSGLEKASATNSSRLVVP